MSLLTNKSRRKEIPSGNLLMDDNKCNGNRMESLGGRKRNLTRKVIQEIIIPIIDASIGEDVLSLCRLPPRHMQR